MKGVSVIATEESGFMIFGKHINRFYLKYGVFLLIGILTLGIVDYLQLVIPRLYQLTVNGINQGYVVMDGVETAFSNEIACISRSF